MLRFVFLVFLDSQRHASHALRPPARGGMVVGTEVDGIGAQPLFLKMRDSKTHTFNVYFLSAELHEFTAAIEERLGKVPDVIMERGRRIDVLLEAGKKLNEFGWAKECTVHAVLNEHEMAHGSPSTSPGASPAPSRPPSPPPSPHLKPSATLPSGAEPKDYMEDERDAGYSDTQQMEMNVSAAGSADPRALWGILTPKRW